MIWSMNDLTMKFMVVPDILLPLYISRKKLILNPYYPVGSGHTFVGQISNFLLYAFVNEEYLYCNFMTILFNLFVFVPQHSYFLLLLERFCPTFYP